MPVKPAHPAAAAGRLCLITKNNGASAIQALPACACGGKADQSSRPLKTAAAAFITIKTLPFITPNNSHISTRKARWI